MILVRRKNESVLRGQRFCLSRSEGCIVRTSEGFSEPQYQPSRWLRAFGRGGDVCGRGTGLRSRGGVMGGGGRAWY